MSTQHPLDILNTKTWRHLPTTISQVEGTEIEVPPPKLGVELESQMQSISRDILYTKEVEIAYSQIKGLDPKASGYLLVIPTQNTDKADVLFNPFKFAVENSDYKAIPYELRLKDRSEVGGQPYGIKAGITGRSKRARNVLLDNIQAINEAIRKYKVRAVFIGSIENYIESRVKINGKIRAVDYGAALYFNPATREIYSLISNGVTVPQAFLEAAKSFDRGLHPDYGKITVGECMSFKIRGIKAADWHKIVLNNGRTRFTILKECTIRILEKSSNEFLGFRKRSSSRSRPKRRSTDNTKTSPSHSLERVNRSTTS